MLASTLAGQDRDFRHAAQPLTAADSAVNGYCTNDNACIMASVYGDHQRVKVTLGGTFVATAQIEGRGPKGPWGVILTESIPGAWTFNSAGYISVRVRCSDYTSGPIQAEIQAIQ